MQRLSEQTSRHTTVVCVATSEATWRNLSKYCFNYAFKSQRPRFDLALVCNGSSDGLHSYIKSLQPDYYLERANLGFDLAAFDALLKLLPQGRYRDFLLLHDDHWFEDDTWFDSLLQLADAQPDIAVFGNLIDCSEDKLVQHFEIISRVLGYGRYLDEPSPVFTQGVAGLYRSSAIDIWLRHDGIPHIHNNLKNLAEVCERLASFMLYHEGCSFMQIPPGYEAFLRHRDHLSSIGAPHSTYSKKVIQP